MISFQVFFKFASRNKGKGAQIISLELREDELDKDHQTHKKQQDKKMDHIENSCKKVKK